MKNLLILMLFTTSLVFGAGNVQKITATAPLTLSSGALAIPAANGSTNGYLSSADWTTFSGTSGNAITALTGGVTATGPGSVAATVVSVGGSTAANVHAAELLANAATSANTASTIVKRDASGNFTAGIITANLTGTATNFSGSLVGDVTGTQGATVASTVGGSSAANIHSAELAANAAASANTASTIVKRDSSGNFTAGTITANLTGSVSGSAASFTGSLVGDVTGTQGATVVSTVGTSSAANVHSAELAANAATSANTVSTIVKRDSSGNFSAGTITATISGHANADLLAANNLSDVTTPATAFNNISGMTLVGDTIYGGASGARSVLPGPTAANSYVLSQTGTGTAGAAPAWVQYTNTNTASTIVKRDASGNFAAGTATFANIVDGGLTASRPVFTDGSQNLVSNAVTGTGNVVMSASPTLTGTVTLPSGTVSSSAWDTGTSTFTSNGIAFTAKAPSASPTFTGTVTLPSGSVTSSAWDTGTSTFTSNGVAFTAKAPSASPTFTGTVTLPSGSVTSSAWDTGTSTFTSNGVAFTAKAPLASPTFTGVLTAANILDSGLTASQAVFTDGSKNLVSNAITGSGNVVMSASPTLTGTVVLPTVNASGVVSITNATAATQGAGALVVTGGIYTGNRIQIGANSATNSSLGFANNTGIGWRNASNNANFELYVDPSNVLQVPTPTVVTGALSTTSTFVATSTVTGSRGIFGGSNPGTSGAVGIPNGTGISWRDGANSTNYEYYLDSSNVFQMPTKVAITGQVQSNTGTVGAPSVSASTDPDTGVNFLTGNQGELVAQGAEVLFWSPTQVAVNQQLRTIAGSAATPSRSFQGDTATGDYLISSGIYGWSTNGTTAGNINNGVWNIGASGGTNVHVINGTLNILSGLADDYDVRIRSSTTTGGARVAVTNSSNSRDFEFKGNFGAGTETLTIGSDSADLMYLNRAGTVISFPNIGTTATGAATATMTNAPAGAAGNPDVWVNFTFNGVVYVMPAWTP